jgi:hypothetical protein
MRNVDAPFRSGVSLGMAHLRDLSATGVGLLMAQQVQPGKVVAIEVAAKGTDKWQLKLIRVAHTTLQDGNRWLVGGAFLQPLNDEELKLLS